MTAEERLTQLEEAIRSQFGCDTRYRNDLWERYQDSATTEERIAVAEKVLAVGPLGIAAHQYECLRREDLGRPKNFS